MESGETWTRIFIFYFFGGKWLVEESDILFLEENGYGH